MKNIDDAYFETEKYYCALESGNQRDKQKEMDVANLWQKVSRDMENYDEQLAKRLSNKSNFWRGGGAWSSDKIEATGIGLKKIWNDCQSQLPRSRKKKAK